jgi:hypothetical protein
MAKNNSINNYIHRIAYKTAVVFYLSEEKKKGKREVILPALFAFVSEVLDSFSEV